jgi:hypothetical protein
MTIRRIRRMLQANMKFEGLDAQTILNNTIRGKLNCTGSVTLKANQGTTTISDELITTLSVVAFQPLSTNAKLEGQPGYSSTENGRVIVDHANNAQTDRTYNYTVLN